MANSITNRQMVFILLLALTTVTEVSVPKTIAETAGTGGWLTLIVTAIIFGIAAYILTSLNNMFQGQVLFDYSAFLVGKVGSYIIGAFYLIFSLAVSSYLCAGMGNILTSNFFANTPSLATILIGMPFYGYTAYKGITNVGRLCEIFGLLYIVTAIIIHATMLFQGDVKNILPLYIPEDTLRYFKAIPSAVISFLAVAVLTFIPISRDNGKKAPIVAFLAILGIGLFYVVLVETSIMMIGMNEIVNQNNALISAIRQIQLPFLNFFERVDIAYLTVGFMGLFAGKTIMLLSVVEFACKLLPRVKRIYIVVAACAAVFVSDIIILNTKNFGEVFEVFAIYTGTVAVIGIPAILFILAKVKKHAHKMG